MNPFAPETVVMIHILYSCHLEWKQVWPKLAEYHLLIPDMPCHSNSKGVCRREDFSIDICVDHIAAMIRKHAHDGRAHLVGLSTGGFVTMELMRRYPELVRTAFVAGAWPPMGIRASLANNPRLTYAALWSILHSPGSIFFKASGLSGEYQNDELLREIKGNGSARLIRGFCRYLSDCENKLDLDGSGIRMCFAIATKGDNVTDALHAASVLKSRGNNVRAFAVQDAIHAWNLQLPLLFGQAIRSWIEGRPMPQELQELQI